MTENADTFFVAHVRYLLWHQANVRVWRGPIALVRIGSILRIESGVTGFVLLPPGLFKNHVGRFLADHVHGTQNEQTRDAGKD